MASKRPTFASRTSQRAVSEAAFPILRPASPKGRQNPIQIIEPTAALFPDAAATGVITGFHVGTRPATVGCGRLASLDQLNALAPTIEVRREQLQSTSRWTSLTRSVTERREGFIELGEICRVHRGQVTGANRIWIANDDMPALPVAVLFPAVTRARELFAVKHTLDDATVLRQVIDLPVDLDVFRGRFITASPPVGVPRIALDPGL